MHWTRVALLAVLLAGCSGGPPADDDPAVPAPEPAGPGPDRTSANGTAPAEPILYDNRTFQLTLDGGGAAGPAWQNGLANCIVLRPGATIVAGNLTLSWTAQSPLTEQLQEVVAVGFNRLHGGPGPSPLVVDLAGIADGRDRNTNFSTQFTQPGGGVRLEVHADLRLQYRGTLDFQDIVAGCTYA